ncbi:MAG TPA: hypothetical protein VF547_10795 [Allosphingosinicella sp.]|jgi:hypothetical protein
MGSSAAERLQLVADLYRAVAPSLRADIAAAQDADVAHALRVNLQSLEMAFIRAGRMNLGAEGEKAEVAYAAARAAAGAAERSFAASVAASAKIAALDQAVGAIDHLLRVANDDDGFGGPRFE